MSNAKSGPVLSLAVVIHQYGGRDQLRVEQIEIRSPGPGEVRVRVAGAAVNPFDIHLREGYAQDFIKLAFPACLGSDVSGVVDAIGVGVTDFAVGDNVIGMLTTGAYAQWAIARTDQLIILPNGIDLVNAAALPTGSLTGIQLVERGLKLKAGAKVLVTGAGGSVGRAAVFAAIDVGAIVYAGVRENGKDAVADLPVEGSIDLADPAALQAAGPFDFVADTVGGVVAEHLFAYLAHGGHFASVVVPFIAPPTRLAEGFTGVIVEFDGPRLQRFAREMVAGGRHMPVSHKFGLREVAEAHALLERGGLRGKIVLELQESSNENS